MQDSDLRVPKTATDSFFETNLADLLTERAISTLVIVGAASDYCVDATARSALSVGFDVDLLSDGHAPASNGDPDAGLTAEQIIERHNRVLSPEIHPGGCVRLIAADDVFCDQSGRTAHRVWLWSTLLPGRRRRTQPRLPLRPAGDPEEKSRQARTGPAR